MDPTGNDRNEPTSVPADSLVTSERAIELSKAILKRLLPQALIEGMAAAATRLLVAYFAARFPPLIIRKNSPDLHVFRDIFLHRSQRIPAAIDPRLIVDGGAHVGFASLYFAWRFPNAHVIAIEPEPFNYQLLERNVEKQPRIKPLKGAIWHRPTELEIVDAGTGNWGFMAQEGERSTGTTAPAIMLDSLLRETGFGTIDVLKLDIEGAEKELFSNSPHSWLKHVGVILIELHDRKKSGCSEAFFEATSHYDWHRFRNGENLVLIRSHLLA